MGELSFLIELLLNHKLAKATKDLISTRIKELEDRMVSQPAQHQPMSAVNQPRPVQAVAQPKITNPYQIIQPEVIDPSQQNAAVQKALADRQAMLNGAQNSALGQGERGGIFKVRPNPPPR